MTITKSGIANIVKKLRTFGISTAKANAAIDTHFTMLYCADVEDWRLARMNLVTMANEENAISIVYEGRLICTMRFPEGVLPQTDLQNAWAEVDAYSSKNPIRNEEYASLNILSDPDLIAA